MLREGLADLCPVSKSEIQVVRPAGVAGNDFDCTPPCPKVFLQLFEGAHSQLIVLRQGADEAVSAIRAEPDGVAGEQVFLL